MKEIMSDKKEKILTASIIVTLVSVIGKFIGFGRDAVIASYYGADWQTDAFFLAQSMPGVVFPAVCNSLSTAFLTVYVTKCVEEQKEADIYGSKAITFSALLAIILSSIAIILAPLFVPLFAPGFTTDQSVLAVHLTRITMSTFVLIMLEYMLGSVLSAKKKFYGAQVAALFFNASIILITIILGKHQGMDALTYTVVIGHIIQIVLLVFFTRGNLRYSFSLKIYDDDMKSLVKLTMPIILGNSIVQVNNIVDKILSSLFGSGAMSALSYSNTLNRFVTGIVITTLSTVIYPVLTEHFSKGKTADFSSTIKRSISIGFIILLPVSIITTTCASDVVNIVYHRGSFDNNAAELTSSTLSFYGMMYVFAAIQEIVTRAFYGMKDTKTPLRVATIAIIGNSVLSYIFSKTIGFGGIALGTTVSTVLAAILLIASLKKRVKGINLAELISSLWKFVISALIMILTVFILKRFSTGLGVISRFLIICLCVFMIHCVVLYILKCKELIDLKNHVINLVSRRIRK